MSADLVQAVVAEINRAADAAAYEAAEDEERFARARDVTPSADLRCAGCNETPTRIATLKTTGLERLTCEMGLSALDDSEWSVRRLTRADFGLAPLPRTGRADLLAARP